MVHFYCNFLSIHAPTRGATLILKDRHLLSYFQSTLLQEERPDSTCVFHKTESFNPRSYKRSDGKTRIATGIANLSIHAPTRGATGEWLNWLQLEALSIHAPTRGATKCIYSYKHSQTLSIHAPTRGATAKMHNIPYASLQ